MAETKIHQSRRERMHHVTNEKVYLEDKLQTGYRKSNNSATALDKNI